MRSREQLLAIMDQVCEDVCGEALNATEVPERLVVVAGADGTVTHVRGVESYDKGGVVAFVNDSGVPFVEQSDHLIAAAAGLEPEAVLLGGSARTGRPGGAFTRVLAVQLFSRRHEMRLARVARVEPSKGPITSVGQWREVKAGPPIWAERLLA